jgi:hypothetical protein
MRNVYDEPLTIFDIDVPALKECPTCGELSDDIEFGLCEYCRTDLEDFPFDREDFGPPFDDPEDEWDEWQDEIAMYADLRRGG